MIKYKIGKSIYDIVLYIYHMSLYNFKFNINVLERLESWFTCRVCDSYRCARSEQDDFFVSFLISACIFPYKKPVSIHLEINHSVSYSYQFFLMDPIFTNARLQIYLQMGLLRYFKF